MKKYEIKKSLSLVRKLKPYLKTYQKAEEAFWKKIQAIERDMEKELGIKDIEFFHADGSLAGIGNGSRTMELIHRHEIEEGRLDKK